MSDASTDVCDAGLFKLELGWLKEMTASPGSEASETSPVIKVCQCRLRASVLCLLTPTVTVMDREREETLAYSCLSLFMLWISHQHLRGRGEKEGDSGQCYLLCPPALSLSFSQGFPSVWYFCPRFCLCLLCCQFKYKENMHVTTDYREVSNMKKLAQK